jgi:hypothetical protein
MKGQFHDMQKSILGPDVPNDVKSAATAALALLEVQLSDEPNNIELHMCRAIALLVLERWIECMLVSYLILMTAPDSVYGQIASGIHRICTKACEPVFEQLLQGLESNSRGNPCDETAMLQGS